MGRLPYTETEEKLRVRIHAHTAYANLSLDDWLADWLGEAAGSRLVEVGCGDGNFFPVYATALGPRGSLVGLDVNDELLSKARAVADRMDVSSQLLQWDFDSHPWPLHDEEIDILTAPFSAYYTNDVAHWVDDALRVLKPGGKLLLLGPAEDNARELFELNEMVTGIATTPETDETTEKLEGSFLPELQKRLGDAVTSTILDRRIVFPSAEEFARYYFATWLYEKTQDRVANPVTFESVVKAASTTSLTLSKRVVCLEGGKG